MSWSYLFPLRHRFDSVGLSLKIFFPHDPQKIMYGSTFLGWKDHGLICEWPLQLDYDRHIIDIASEPF